MREHSALILEPEKDSKGVQRATFNVRTVVPYSLLYHFLIVSHFLALDLDYYHRIPIVMEKYLHPYLESINIRYPTEQNARNFLVKFLVNFQRKRVEISIMCECNLKIVKICQKCADFESGSLSEKLLRIEKIAQNRQVSKKLPSRICLGLYLNLGTCQKLATGEGVGILNLGSEIRPPIPAMGVKFANPPLELGLKYHDLPALV